ncbi:hypothetical protein CCACVL1_13103 [Corchorus capsularis]|uniref:Uncharacterized protein n=1 Tax=Corchorus capsularis TaxID=210143 RepID=A0A1R3ICB2_COCAP|nr:hypothetical protein CCACVL1_13103 [Corchorus capsularis]
MGKQKEEEEEHIDNQRESAIASALPFQPNFNPSGVTQQQLSKFRELHRRRLQIKAKSKIHKTPKDRTKKIPAEGCSTRDSQEADSNAKIEASSVPNLKGHGEDKNPFAQQDNVDSIRRKGGKGKPTCRKVGKESQHVDIREDNMASLGGWYLKCELCYYTCLEESLVQPT